MFPRHLAVLLNETEEESRSEGSTSNRFMTCYTTFKGNSLRFSPISRKYDFGNRRICAQYRASGCLSTRLLRQLRGLLSSRSNQILINKCPESLEVRNAYGKSPYMYRIAEKRKSRFTQGLQASKACGENTEDLATRFLMEEYMQGKYYKEVIQYLYRNVPGTH